MCFTRKKENTRKPLTPVDYSPTDQMGQVQGYDPYGQPLQGQDEAGRNYMGHNEQYEQQPLDYSNQRQSYGRGKEKNEKSLRDNVVGKLKQVTKVVDKPGNSDNTLTDIADEMPEVELDDTLNQREPNFTDDQLL